MSLGGATGWTPAEVAAAADGTLVDGAAEGTRVTGPVVLDSRRAEPGALFVAVPGEHVDGHDYAVAAVGSGAALVLAQRPVGVPAVVVADVPAGLGRLATAHLSALSGVRTVGVTGSSGKTSTKDLLAAVLETAGPTVATAGSFNNELGLPLTVTRADGDTRWLVLEMGARGIGHIASLCALAPPQVGVVLNVGSAHVGEFGGRAAIAQAKGELVEALPPEGLAVLNADDPLVAAMAERTAARVVTFGLGSGADVRADDVTLDPLSRASFVLSTAEGSAPVALQVFGEHQVANALAAAAVGREAGLSVAAVADALSSARSRSRWRMEVAERPDGVVVVNDAYNANPESMRAALKALAGMGRAVPRGSLPRRTWAVLGEMRELGDVSAQEHDALGRLVVRLDIHRLVAVGEPARAISLAAGLEGSWGGEAVWVPDVDAALALLRAEVEPGDIVLVKASRAVGLERVAAALLPEDATWF